MKKVLFFGTPDFAVPTFEALTEHFEVVGVVSQPDKPQGRKQLISPTPVSAAAQKHNISVFQPESLKNEQLLPTIQQLDPDVIVVVAYGKLLPKYILNYPKYGCINLHGSILPKYRGAAPIQWAVINGDLKTGVTFMHMDSGMDTGDILYVHQTDIQNNETAGMLFTRMSTLCGDIVCDVLQKIMDGKLKRVKQDETAASHAPMLDKTMARIDWNNSPQKIVNLIRGLNPWPVAYSCYQGKKFKIFEASSSCVSHNKPFGTIIDVGDSLVVAANGGAVRIESVQFENKRRMSVADYIKGNKINKGDVL